MQTLVRCARLRCRQCRQLHLWLLMPFGLAAAQGNIYGEGGPRFKSTIARGNHKGQKIAAVLPCACGSIRVVYSHQHAVSTDVFVRGVEEIERHDLFCGVVMGALNYRSNGWGSSQQRILRPSSKRKHG